MWKSHSAIPFVASPTTVAQESEDDATFSATRAAFASYTRTTTQVPSRIIATGSKNCTQDTSDVGNSTSYTTSNIGTPGIHDTRNTPISTSSPSTFDFPYHPENIGDIDTINIDGLTSHDSFTTSSLPSSILESNSATSVMDTFSSKAAATITLDKSSFHAPQISKPASITINIGMTNNGDVAAPASLDVTAASDGGSAQIKIVPMILPAVLVGIAIFGLLGYICFRKRYKDEGCTTFTRKNHGSNQMHTGDNQNTASEFTIPRADVLVAGNTTVVSGGFAKGHKLWTKGKHRVHERGAVGRVGAGVV